MYGNPSLLQELRAENVLDGLAAKHLVSAINLTEGVARSTYNIRLFLTPHKPKRPLREGRICTEILVRKQYHKSYLEELDLKFHVSCESDRFVSE
jgi:hypothetical protein